MSIDVFSINESILSFQNELRRKLKERDDKDFEIKEIIRIINNKNDSYDRSKEDFNSIVAFEEQKKRELTNLTTMFPKTPFMSHSSSIISSSLGSNVGDFVDSIDIHFQKLKKEIDSDMDQRLELENRKREVEQAIAIIETKIRDLCEVLKNVNSGI